MSEETKMPGAVHVDVTGRAGMLASRFPQSTPYIRADLVQELVKAVEAVADENGVPEIVGLVVLDVDEWDGVRSAITTIKEQLQER